jgi:hypothetical protein
MRPWCEEAIYEAAAGFLTSPGARLLLVGNPTRVTGEFFDAFHASRGFYSTIAIPAVATPAFTDEKTPRAVRRRLVSQGLLMLRRCVRFDANDDTFNLRCGFCWPLSILRLRRLVLPRL